MAESYRCLLPVDNICPALIAAQGNNCPRGWGGEDLCSALVLSTLHPPPRPPDPDIPMGMFLRQTRGDAPRPLGFSGVHRDKRRGGTSRGYPQGRGTGVTPVRGWRCAGSPPLAVSDGSCQCSWWQGCDVRSADMYGEVRASPLFNHGSFSIIVFFPCNVRSELGFVAFSFSFHIT